MKDKNKLGIILDYCNIFSVTDSIFKRPIKYMLIILQITVTTCINIYTYAIQFIQF